MQGGSQTGLYWFVQRLCDFILTHNFCVFVLERRVIIYNNNTYLRNQKNLNSVHINLQKIDTKTK